MLNILPRKEHVTRYIKFIEHVFPFTSEISQCESQSLQPLCPSPSIICLDSDFNMNHLSTTAIPTDQLTTTVLEISDQSTTLDLILPTKPSRIRKLPAKFKYYTGLPSTIVTNCSSSHLSGTIPTYPLHYYMSYH